MKYVSILSDMDSVDLKAVPDELYDRIMAFVNPENYPFPDLQPLYDNLCNDEEDIDEVGAKLWDELNDCESLDCDLIQVY